MPESNVRLLLLWRGFHRLNRCPKPDDMYRHKPRFQMQMICKSGKGENGRICVRNGAAGLGGVTLRRKG